MAQGSAACHPAGGRGTSPPRSDWQHVHAEAPIVCRLPLITMHLRSYARLNGVRKDDCYFAECVPAKNANSIQREYSSWLSLATRSNASLGFLMRYW